VALTAAVVALLVASRDQRRPGGYLPRGAMNIDEPDWSETQQAQREAFVEPGYFPATAGAGDPAASASDDGRRWAATEAGSRVLPRVTADHRIELAVQAEAGTGLVLASRASPDWAVRIDGRLVRAAPDPARGFIRVDVPPGTHVLRAELQDTRLRRLANTASAATAAATILLLAAAAPRRGQV
jgi:hypothetical protein